MAAAKRNLNRPSRPFWPRRLLHNGNTPPAPGATHCLGRTIWSHACLPFTQSSTKHAKINGFVILAPTRGSACSDGAANFPEPLLFIKTAHELRVGNVFIVGNVPPVVQDNDFN